MSQADSAYSFSLTTFSPSGKLLQIEHALAAVNRAGTTTLGIRATNGVVIASERKSPPLVDQSTFHTIEKITDSVGISYAGLGGDFRVLLQHARKRAAAYYLTYHERIPVRQITQQTATVIQEFTQQGGVRPFGVSLLVAGYDDEGPQLFQADPSGAYFEWKATAVGANYVNAKAFLDKRYTEDMELEDAIHTALLTLREGFEGEITKDNIEIGVIGSDRVFRILTPAQVQDYLEENQ
jgi:20S proteasome subunit alpha 2